VTAPSVDIFGGVRVVELAQWVFVPVAGALLADWGAEVLKIEHPQGGDGYRGLLLAGASASDSPVNYAMEMVNRNKKSVAIDLKTEAGREVLLKLVASADIFLTNFLPSVLDRLGLGVETLRSVNPRLIYARGHGYGARGPDADTPAYDSTSFWARGAIEETLAPGGLPEPMPQRGAVGDRYAGTQLAFGIAGALYRQVRTGEGSVVDVSLIGTALWTIGSDVLAQLQGVYRQTPPLGPPRKSLPNPLVASYRCSDDRWLMICCLQPDKYWRGVCTLLGRPDLLADERFASLADRAANSAVLTSELEAAFATRPLADWRALLDAHHVPWGPYQRVDELLEDPAVTANGYIGTVTRADGTSFPLPTGAVQFDECPAAVTPCPELGEHTDEVLGSLGFDWDAIVDLKVKGAVL
jgi:crotonobetainyl-CoA:carnitine CoA-transferase CaiB-like acyl-CoA transferase